MKALRPDQKAELEKALAARAEHERRLAENGITAEEERAAFKQFGEDCRYMSSLHRELVEQYPDLWVAMYRKEVIAVASTHRELLKQVSSLVQKPGSAVIRFMHTNPPKLIV